MIIKHVTMRTPRKSSFGDLIRYLSDPKNTSERVGAVRITNCHSDELTDAMLEVMATQACNTRAKGDKTYHLIISFRAGEEPSDDVLATIEQRVCAGLGFADHQRVSAAHHDTDNLHIHLAINKIHPARLTLHEPYLAYRTLADLCVAIEAEYGLEHDNHQTSRRGSANGAENMERAAGIESLQGWIKRECSTQLQDAQSWPEVHEIMQRNGLALRERGNGLIIQNSDGLAVKASAISRDLSKAKLVARLGAFKPAAWNGEHSSPEQAYRPRPAPSRIDTSELYARYKSEQLQQNAQRTTSLKQAREQKRHAIESAQAKARTKRAAIKLLSSVSLTKKLLYAQAHQTLRKEVAAVQERHQYERTNISERYGRRSWPEWLQHQAKAGNKEALAALRANLARQALKGNIVTGRNRHPDTPAARPDHVTKKGTLIYRVGQTAIRDDGEKLSVATGASLESLATALQMATERYGRILTVTGNDEFKEHIAQAAAAAKLSVRFNDPKIEGRRLALLAVNRSNRNHIKPTQNTHR